MRIAFIHPKQIKEWEYDKVLNELQNSWFDNQQTIRTNILNAYKTDIPHEGCYTPSSGLLTLASISITCGHQTKYYEQQFHIDQGDWEEKLIEIVQWADIVAITCMTVTSNNAYLIIKELNDIGFSGKVIMGGPHVSFLPDEAIDNGVDIVVVGEGEAVWTELMENETIVNSLKNHIIKGTMVDINQYTSFESALSLLPKEIIMDMDLHVFASRSCPNKCKFCSESSFFNKYRLSKPEDTANLIKAIVKLGKTDTIYFSDSHFPLNEGFLEELNDHLNPLFEEYPQLAFRGMLRADGLTKKTVDLLQQLRFVEVCIGVESADNHVLNESGKNETTEHYINAFNLMKGRIPLVRTSWMIGLPGITKKSITKNIEFMKYLFTNDLITEASFRMFIPYPGTWYYQNSKKVGLSINDYDWELWGRRQFPPPYRTKEMNEEEIYTAYMECLEECNHSMAEYIRRNKHVEV